MSHFAAVTIYYFNSVLGPSPEEAIYFIYLFIYLLDRSQQAA